MDHVRGLVPLALAVATGAKASELWMAGLEPAAAMFAVACVGLLWRPRFGAALLVVATVPFVYETAHTVLLGMVALTVTVFPHPRQRLLLYRTQLTALYLGAGLAKALGPWATGSTLETLGIPSFLAAVPVEPIIWAVVAGEVTAGVLLWVDDRLALVVGLGVHLGIVVGTSATFADQLVPLYVFNGLAAAMLIAVTTERFRCSTCRSGTSRPDRARSR